MTRDDLERCVGACGLLFSLGLAACASDSGTEPVTIRLASNAACYGFQIDVGGAAASVGWASSQAVSCVATPELAAAGCSPSVTTSKTELHLGTRGCLVPDGTPLFDCELPGSLVREAENAASVHCGCGCATTCPQDPAIQICKGTPESCAAAAAATALLDENAVPASDPVLPAVQLTTTSSSTTYCGTCCDVATTPRVGLTDAVTLSEIAFEFTLPSSGPRCPQIDCWFAHTPRGPSTISQNGNTVRACVSDPGGLDGPTTLLRCDVVSGGSDSSEVNVLRALGADLASVTPPPRVEFEPLN